ncbi:MAG: peptidylprolyl isomerase [Rikenellaceae bacterium]
MKQRFILGKSLLAFLVSVVVATPLFSQEINEEVSNRQKFVIDEVVAVVGSSSIMYSDLIAAEEYIRMQYIQRGFSSNNSMGEALEGLLTQKLLMTQAAIDSLTVSEGSVEQQTEMRLSQLIEGRGSTEELEKFYNKPIFAIKDLVRVKVRESEMANTMQNQVQSGVSITPAEVAKFYKKINTDSLPIVPEQYEIAKIAKVPSKSEDRKLDVKEQLLDIRSRILNGASFSALARMYSDDIGSASRGGEMEAQPASNFVQAFKDAVETTRVGQLSEIVETEHGFHILEVMEQRGQLYRVRHILLKIKFDAEDKIKALETLDSVAKEIKIDNLDFERAVAEFSNDEDSRINKGLVTNNVYENYGARYKSTHFTKEELGRMYEYIKDLEIGETTDAFEYIDDMLEESVVIVKLMDIIPAHTANIEEDYNAIEDMALAEKRNKIFNEWLDEKINKMYIKIEKPYDEIRLDNELWKK